MSLINSQQTFSEQPRTEKVLILLNIGNFQGKVKTQVKKVKSELK